MEVRRATAEDLDTIGVMSRAMHQESPRYRDMAFDDAKLRRLAQSLLTVPYTALFVAETDGQVVGMAAVAVSERWFGPDRYVTDIGIYLVPEHRGGGGFPVLVQAVEAWARECGAQQLDLGVSTGVEADRAVRAYERMGYTVADTRVLTKKLGADDVYWI